MYYSGNLSEFITWHDAVKIAEGIPTVGYVNGEYAPQNQQTTAYCEAIPHPDNKDHYIWNYGKYPINGKESLSLKDVKSLGWFTEV